MYKKLIAIFFTFVLCLFMISIIFADSIPVEDIFSDIDSDYQYKNQLQTLYDGGMLEPNSDGNFNPRDLLTRQEFVGIMMEVTCKKCIQPDTSFDILQKYIDREPSFFDVKKTNKYFYCVEDAVSNGYISGYHKATVCEDGSYRTYLKPFCSNNTIILEEALAIVLRASGILANSEAEQIRQDIANGIITESLSDDVHPKNSDGSVYSFYPDFQKALEYEVRDVDIDGNVDITSLIEIVNGKIRPKQAISKEDFLRIAYLTLRANSCEDRTDNNLALNIVDYSANAFSTCKEGIDEPEGYIWRFYNLTTGEEVRKNGQNLGNYDFLEDGPRRVFLRAIDNCGNTAEVYNTVIIGDNTGVNTIEVGININPISGDGPLLVNFEGIALGGNGTYIYSWDFGDGNNGLSNEVSNVFRDTGVYNVVLTVTDSDGNTGIATGFVNVTGMSNTPLDSDGDEILDIDDLCPLVVGVEKNSGCPILEEECDQNLECKQGYACNSNTNICLPESLPNNNCRSDGGDIIHGSVECNTCPCVNTLDFISSLRKCDIIFPAITSKDSSEIYSKGNLYQIR